MITSAILLQNMRYYETWRVKCGGHGVLYRHCLKKWLRPCPPTSLVIAPMLMITVKGHLTDKYCPTRTSLKTLENHSAIKAKPSSLVLLKVSCSPAAGLGASTIFDRGYFCTARHWTKPKRNVTRLPAPTTVNRALCHAADCRRRWERERAENRQLRREAPVLRRRAGNHPSALPVFPRCAAVCPRCVAVENAREVLERATTSGKVSLFRTCFFPQRSTRRTATTRSRSRAAGAESSLQARSMATWTVVEIQ